MQEANRKRILDRIENPNSESISSSDDDSISSDETIEANKAMVITKKSSV